MKLKEFFKNLFFNCKDGISRFLVAFICSVLAFLTLSFEVIFETNSDEIIVPLCMTYALVAVFSVLLKITQEYVCENINRIIQNALCFAVAVAGFFLIKINFDSLYTVMAYTGIVIALLCFIFYIIMRGENRDTAFPRVVTSCVFASAIGGVLSGGLSICIIAFQSLIFSMNNSYKIHLIINLFVWAICFVNIFLALLPKKDVPIAQSKVFRTFILFVGLPLYILLIVILLIYLAKIVITWNMPVGEINWYASFASLFFIFFLLSVMQYTEKIAKLFVKFGGFFLLPVLVMQSIAVFERINAYGLTTPRTISLVLIVISILFIVGAILIPKHLNKIALASGIIVLLVTITPFNVIDMPVSSQTGILKTALEANNMIENGVVVPNENVSKEDATKIISAYQYLKHNANKVPDFIPDKDKKPKEIFGFASDLYEDNDRIYCSFSTKDSVDISAYSQMITAPYHDNYIIKVAHNNQLFEIDIKKIAQQLYHDYGTNNDLLDIYKIDENMGLYIKNLNVHLEENEIVYCHLNGYVLFK